MPMPPTSSEIDATAASEQSHHVAAALGGLGDLAQIADIEIVVLPGLDMMALMQRVGDLLDGVGKQVLAARLGENYLHHAGQLGRRAEGTDYSGAGVVNRSRIGGGRVRIL